MDAPTRTDRCSPPTGDDAGRAGVGEGCSLTTGVRSGRRPAGTPGARGLVAIDQVAEAAAMLAIDWSSTASKSASLCCAERPSVSAREKLAITP